MSIIISFHCSSSFLILIQFILQFISSKCYGRSTRCNSKMTLWYNLVSWFSPGLVARTYLLAPVSHQPCHVPFMQAMRKGAISGVISGFLSRRLVVSDFKGRSLRFPVAGDSSPLTHHGQTLRRRRIHTRQSFIQCIKN